MITRYVFYTDQGEIYREYTGNTLPDNPEGLNVLNLGECVTPIQNHYVDSGYLVAMPTKPDEFSAFDYESKSWKDSRTAETEWILIRRKRDTLLSASDWTQLPDVPLATKSAWATYRQALRDITEQPGYPVEVIWPITP